MYALVGELLRRRFDSALGAATMAVTGTDIAATALSAAVDSMSGTVSWTWIPPARHYVLLDSWQPGARITTQHARIDVRFRRQKGTTTAHATAMVASPGNPALLFFLDQELWFCGPASQRVCPSRLP